jgi:gas vesicle protein
MSRSSSTGNFLVGTLLGAALGGLFGLLLAPRSGTETRKLIQDEMSSRYNTSRDSLKGKYEESLDTLKAKADVLKDRVRSLSEELEEVGRRTVNRLTESKTPADSTTEG